MRAALRTVRMWKNNSYTARKRTDSPFLPRQSFGAGERKRYGYPGDRDCCAIGCGRDGFSESSNAFFNTDTDSEIVFGLENRGIPRETLRSRLDELTEELHLSELRGRNIFELSGGEKQKIAFSSVYASVPDVLVFDEPSSNLDMKAIGELADLIQRRKYQERPF